MVRQVDTSADTEELGPCLLEVEGNDTDRPVPRTDHEAPQPQLLTEGLPPAVLPLPGKKWVHWRAGGLNLLPRGSEQSEASGGPHLLHPKAAVA
jgi:hypothetical protein